MPAYVFAPSDVRKMVDNTYYNHGLELTLVEQDVFIEVLKSLSMAAYFFNAGASFTPYVPFVLQLAGIKLVKLAWYDFYYSVSSPSFSKMHSY